MNCSDAMNACRDICLDELAAGSGAIVVGLDGGPGAVSRMAALGFTPGVQVWSVRNSGHGPIIVAVLGTEVALGRGQARRIRVRVA